MDIRTARSKGRNRIAPIALGGVVIAVLGSGAISAPASTAPVARTDPPSTVPELLSRGTTVTGFDAESSGVELEARHKVDVAVVRVAYPTGSSSGWHRHPGPTVVTVTKGNLTYISGDCERLRVGPGDTFVENGGPSEVGRLNNRAGEPGEIVVTFFAPVGVDPLTIPAPAPACAHN